MAATTAAVTIERKKPVHAFAGICMSTSQFPAILYLLGARPSNASRAPSSALRAGYLHEFRPFFADEAGLLGACSHFSDTLRVLTEVEDVSQRRMDDAELALL